MTFWQWLGIYQSFYGWSRLRMTSRLQKSDDPMIGRPGHEVVLVMWGCCSPKANLSRRFWGQMSRWWWSVDFYVLTCKLPEQNKELSFQRVVTCTDWWRRRLSSNSHNFLKFIYRIVHSIAHLRQVWKLKEFISSSYVNTPSSYFLHTLTDLAETLQNGCSSVPEIAFVHPA